MGSLTATAPAAWGAWRAASGCSGTAWGALSRRSPVVAVAARPSARGAAKVGRPNPAGDASRPGRRARGRGLGRRRDGRGRGPVLGRRRRVARARGRPAEAARRRRFEPRGGDSGAMDRAWMPSRARSRAPRGAGGALHDDPSSKNAPSPAASAARVTGGSGRGARRLVRTRGGRRRGGRSRRHGGGSVDDEGRP